MALCSRVNKAFTHTRRRPPPAGGFTRVSATARSTRRAPLAGTRAHGVPQSAKLRGHDPWFYLKDVCSGCPCTCQPHRRTAAASLDAGLMDVVRHSTQDDVAGLARIAKRPQYSCPVRTNPRAISDADGVAARPHDVRLALAVSGLPPYSGMATPALARSSCSCSKETGLTRCPSKPACAARRLSSALP